MDGEEAHRVGLLHRLVEPEHVLPAAIELADEIAGNDQRMVQGAKRLMSEGIGMSWRAQLDRELAAQKGPLAGAPAD